eukprot:c19334_g1_i1 orf=204-1418(+)
MAPKRTRRVTSERSSFVECPACHMHVFGCLINDHLDWNCSTLIAAQQHAHVHDCIDPKEVMDADSAHIEATDTLFDLTKPAMERHDCLLEICSNLSFHTTETMGKRAIDKYGLPVEHVELGETVFCGETEEYISREEYCKEGNENRIGSPEGSQGGIIYDGNCQEAMTGFTNGSTNSNDLVTIECNEKTCSHGFAASISNLLKSNEEQWKFSLVWSVLKAPRGHLVVENFISPEEEDHLICCLDMDFRNPWKLKTFNGCHRGKAYGAVTDLKRRKVQPAVFEMPSFLDPIIERMNASIPCLKEFCPNEMNSIEYCKEEGHWLKPHVDDRQLSGNILVNLSLCGACKMTYERERGPKERYKVFLKRQSLQVLTGESRYNFTHSIQNQDLLGPRRVSLTFRQTVLS